MPSIPASAIVTINPGVIAAGGTGVSLTGLLLTTSARVPIGSVISFSSQAAVAAYFGPASAEAAWATTYFSGFDSSTLKPGSVLIYQYNTANVGAYLRGNTISALSLTALQALAGVLVVTIDGVVKTSSAISLTGATGFVNAAQLINLALATTAAIDGVTTGSIATTTLTVTAMTSGQIQVGDVLSGGGITAGTYITGLVTGTGGVGTYTVSVSQTVVSTTITANLPAVTYDAIAGAFVVSSGTTGASSSLTVGSGSIAAGLLLTTATGAVLSQGVVTATPATAMAALTLLTQNFVSFTTLFQPVTADKISFAQWANGQNNRYLYVCWDTDVTVTLPNPTASAGYAIITTNSYTGTCLIYQPSDLGHAAFLMGAIASIDVTQTNGRVNLSFRTQSGLLPGVTNQTIASQLALNGYNYYGAYATATTLFNFFFPGTVSGPFKYVDSFIDQVSLNSALQASLLTLLTQAKSVPYNDVGYAFIRQACMDPINAALNFGSIRPNVPLSALQIGQVNAAAGLAIDGTLASRGWYLQVLPASPVVRAARGTPPINFFYMDGQGVQNINVSSLQVQ